MVQFHINLFTQRTPFLFPDSAEICKLSLTTEDIISKLCVNQ